MAAPQSQKLWQNVFQKPCDLGLSSVIGASREADDETLTPGNGAFRGVGAVSALDGTSREADAAFSAFAGALGEEDIASLFFGGVTGGVGYIASNISVSWRSGKLVDMKLVSRLWLLVDALNKGVRGAGMFARGAPRARLL